MIEIIEEENHVVIKRDGKPSIIEINQLGEIRAGSAELSNLIIHLGGKSWAPSQIMIEELLIPLAMIIEKHYPSKIDWMETFIEAEKALIVIADNTYQNRDEFIFDKNTDLNALEQEFENEEKIREEIPNSGREDIIRKYLQKNSLL